MGRDEVVVMGDLFKFWLMERSPHPLPVETLTLAKSLLTLLPHRWFQYEESNPIELISEDAIPRCSSK